MTGQQKRRIEDRLPTEKLDWEDPDVKAAKEHTRLANAMAVAGAALLAHTRTAAALAAIPNTSPQQYVAAGTLAMIAKVLPSQHDAAVEALRPFAELAELFDEECRTRNLPDSGPIMSWQRPGKDYALTVEHLCMARDVLAVCAAGGSPDWRTYHSALSQCAELLDNMPDGHPITDTPRFLAAKLEQLQASRSRVEGGHGEQESSTSAPLIAPAPLTDELPKSNDGKEQDAFEAWASGEKYDMTTHPLHWLFLNERTYAARQGWKAALEYVGEVAKAAPAAPVQTEKSTVIDMMQDLMRFECVLTPEGKAEMYASETGAYVWFDHVISTIEGAPSVAAPVQAEQAQAEPNENLSLLAILALQEAGEIAQKALAPKLSGPELRNQFKRIINVARAGIADVERLAAPVSALPAQAEQAAAVRAMPEYSRIREEFALACKMGRTFCINSAMLNVDALVRSLAKEAAIQAPSQADNNNED